MRNRKQLWESNPFHLYVESPLNMRKIKVKIKTPAVLTTVKSQQQLFVKILANWI